MKTYKNINFTKRDYETTNIVFVQSETAPNENFAECNESELTNSNCQPLYTQEGVKYFGYL